MFRRIVIVFAAILSLISVPSFAENSLFATGAAFEQRPFGFVFGQNLKDVSLFSDIGVQRKGRISILPTSFAPNPIPDGARYILSFDDHYGLQRVEAEILIFSDDADAGKSLEMYRKYADEIVVRLGESKAHFFLHDSKINPSLRFCIPQGCALISDRWKENSFAVGMRLYSNKDGKIVVSIAWYGPKWSSALWEAN